MSWYAAAPLFLVSLVVTLAAARLFARRLDRLGVRFGFPEALIGLLTALAADGPEISSALFALFRGAHSVSVGVLVGSNAFNLAAMIGLSALLAGCVRLHRETLLLEGVFGAAITLLAAAVLLRWLGGAPAALLAAVVIVPYLLVVIGGSELLLHRHGSRGLRRSLAQRPARVRESEPGERPTHHLLGLVVVDLALILAGSAGMVQAALALGDRWHVSRAALGVLILAPLTSIPNAMTGVRLGRAGRAAALVGETFNSNTINLGFGVIVPSLLVTFTAVTTLGKLQLAWLVAATLFTLGALARRGGMRRSDAVMLVVVYFAFVGGTLVGS